MLISRRVVTKVLKQISGKLSGTASSTGVNLRNIQRGSEV